MAKNERPFVILIDTNAMVALSLYVESCEAVKAELGTTDKELKKKFKEIKNTKKDLLYFEEKGGITHGYKLFNHLKNKIKQFDTVRIWFSILSEIELLDIFLDRSFDEELTKKGIPYTIRRKKPFRMQVDFNYEKKVAKSWENLTEKLKAQGIEFDNPEKESDAIQDIIKIAKIVTNYVALEPVDLYLYAAGIYLRADEINTYDSEFKAIINKIRTDGEWRNIRDNIQKDLKKYIKEFEEEYQKEEKINLPKGVS